MAEPKAAAPQRTADPLRRSASEARPGADYAPIRDYAAIGDCHGAALVGASGNVDWCCLERFDADPVLCRLLDAERGGFLSVRPHGPFTSERAYLGPTNILVTTFRTESGTVALTDFMPVGRRPGSGTHDYVSLAAPGRLVRLIEGLEGRVRLQVGYRPSVAFARRRARLSAEPGCIAAEGGPTLHLDLDLSIESDLARGTVDIAAGDRRALVLAGRALEPGAALAQAPRLLEITRAFWEEWIAYCRYKGPYRAAVQRSALALKLMTFAPSGALVAALTTSLPEQIGGARNWDYRYCWLRDSAFTLYALAALGYGGEARRFAEFLNLCCRQSLQGLQVVYGVGGETDLDETCHDHLAGYCQSRPVRTGNEAFRQRQIDIYGEVLDWALLFATLGGHLPEASRSLLAGLVDYVAAHWHEPDQGLWEMRGPPRHHLHGKVMSWVALDRAGALLGQRDDWAELRRRIEGDIRARGIDPNGGHLRQAYDGPGVDAALLLVPMLGFPVDGEVMAKTVAAVQRELGHGPFLRRYACDDGLEGGEGAFLICSFWLVDALLCLGRYEEARSLFERLLAAANDVGLYSEEVEPRGGAFLGNFPQAFTHLALIGSAIHLDLYQKGGPQALVGGYADRARRSVTATLGWRALWAALRDTGRLGRLFSSRHSILPDSLTP